MPPVAKFNNEDQEKMTREEYYEKKAVGISQKNYQTRMSRSYIFMVKPEFEYEV